MPSDHCVRKEVYEWSWIRRSGCKPWLLGQWGADRGMGSTSSGERWYNMVWILRWDTRLFYYQILTLSPPNYCCYRFARLRLSLRFELLCLDSNLDASESKDKQHELCPSVGLKKIQKLSRLGAHEDLKQGRNSMSTPDLPHYFGNMLGVWRNTW